MDSSQRTTTKKLSVPLEDGKHTTVSAQLDEHNQQPFFMLEHLTGMKRSKLLNYCIGRALGVQTESPRANLMEFILGRERFIQEMFELAKAYHENSEMCLPGVPEDAEVTSVIPSIKRSYPGDGYFVFEGTIVAHYNAIDATVGAAQFEFQLILTLEKDLIFQASPSFLHDMRRTLLEREGKNPNVYTISKLDTAINEAEKGES